MTIRAGLALAVLCAAAAGCDIVSRAEYVKLNDRLSDCRDRLGSTKKEEQRLRELSQEQAEQIRTLQGLGDKRLDMLYTVARIEPGAYCAGVNTDKKPGDDAVKVFIDPVDQFGSVIKAAGGFKIELYDLAAPPDQNRVGLLELTPAQAGKEWYGGFGVYHYAFTCPFSRQPLHSEITVRVEFVEYLTGKTLTAQKVVTIQLAPGRPDSAPASAPAPAKP